VHHDSHACPPSAWIWLAGAFLIVVLVDMVRQRS
jgi:hypothetical protein